MRHLGTLTVTAERMYSLPEVQSVMLRLLLNYADA